MEFKHIPVLYRETLDGLNIRGGGLYVDGTLGGGGHTEGILSECETARVIGIDRDGEAVAAASERLASYGERFHAVKGNFKDIKDILSKDNIEAVDGVMLDLGVSSYQLDNGERGFSYMHNARLDMRMSRDAKKDAYEVINTYSAERLAEVFYAYGEEKWSKRIAEFIVREREKKPIETTFELTDIIKAAIPAKMRAGGGHPAKRVFQAVRIEVNGELEILKQAIEDICSVLKPGGRLCVITFHSLEDRITKQTFAALAAGCICPKSFPVCVCGNKPKAKTLTRKPILPSEEEISNNSRSKSAKLRILEKL